MSVMYNFVSSMGYFNIVTVEVLEHIHAFVGNTGHFGYEIDLVVSEGLEMQESRYHHLSRIVSSSPLVTVLSCWLQANCLDGYKDDTRYCVTVGDCKTIFCRQAELFKNSVADNREQNFLASVSTSYKSVGLSMNIFHAALLSTCFHVASPPSGMRVRLSARSTIYSFFAGMLTRGTWFTGIPDSSFCILFAVLWVLVFLDFVYWIHLKFGCAPDPSGGRGRMAMPRSSSLASLWPDCTLCSCCRVHRVSLK